MGDVRLVFFDPSGEVAGLSLRFLANLDKSRQAPVELGRSRDMAASVSIEKEEGGVYLEESEKLGTKQQQ